MNQSNSFRPVSLAVFLVVALILYFGLGVFFYSPETRFSWFLSFLGLSLLVMVFFAVIVVWHAKKHSSASQQERTEQIRE